MNVQELIDYLDAFEDKKLQVEVATNPDPDEWYEIYNLEILPNYRGELVVAINTD